jgi:hypothetical protein
MNRTRITTAAIAALTLSAALWAAPALADPQYDLRLKVGADQQWSFEQTTSSSTQVTAGGQQMQQSGSQKRAGTITILAIKDDVPSAVQVTFSPDSGQSATMNGQSQQQPFPLASKTVRVRKDDLGIVTVDGAATDPATTNELQGMLVPDRSIYPKGPVSVGDEWAGDAAALMKSMGCGPTDTMTIKCKLTRIGSVAGRPTADIAVNVVGSQTQNGVTAKITMDGTSQVDLATGQTLASDLTGTTDLSGQTMGPQGPVGIKGDGKMEVHQSARPISGVPSMTPPPVVAPVNDGGNPLGGGGGGGGGNPLAGGSAPDPFTGTFRDNKISIELAPNKLPGTYGATITMGDRQFLADAKADGSGKLVGSFEANGNRFDFTATVDGSTLHFTTGQTQYTLTKPGAANPLDTGGGGGASGPRPGRGAG